MGRTLFFSSLQPFPNECSPIQLLVVGSMKAGLRLEAGSLGVGVEEEAVVVVVAVAVVVNSAHMADTTTSAAAAAVTIIMGMVPTAAAAVVGGSRTISTITAIILIRTMLPRRGRAAIWRGPVLRADRRRLHARMRTMWVFRRLCPGLAFRFRGWVVGNVGSVGSVRV